MLNKIELKQLEGISQMAVSKDFYNDLRRQRSSTSQLLTSSVFGTEAKSKFNIVL